MSLHRIDNFFIYVRSVARVGKKETYITIKDELNRIRLSRYKLGKYVFEIIPMNVNLRNYFYII